MQPVKRDILAKKITTNANALINIVHDVMLEYVPSALHCSGIHIAADVAYVAVTVRIIHVTVMIPASNAVPKNMETSVRVHVIRNVETKIVIEMVTVSLAETTIIMDQPAINIVGMLFQIVIGVMVKMLTLLHVQDVTMEST